MGQMTSAVQSSTDFRNLLYCHRISLQKALWCLSTPIGVLCWLRFAPHTHVHIYIYILHISFSLSLSLSLSPSPRSRIRLEELADFQLVQKFPAFCGTRRFITAFTSTRNLSLSCAIYMNLVVPQNAEKFLTEAVCMYVCMSLSSKTLLHGHSLLANYASNPFFICTHPLLLEVS
jgi:hypothetical protein